MSGSKAEPFATPKKAKVRVLGCVVEVVVVGALVVDDVDVEGPGTVAGAGKHAASEGFGESTVNKATHPTKRIRASNDFCAREKRRTIVPIVMAAMAMASIHNRLDPVLAKH